MEIVEQFLDALLSLLPLSPFTEFFDYVRSLPFLPALNWFFPIASAAVVLRTWLVAVGLYFLYNLIMRKVGIIQ